MVRVAKGLVGILIVTIGISTIWVIVTMVPWYITVGALVIFLAWVFGGMIEEYQETSY